MLGVLVPEVRAGDRGGIGGGEGESSRMTSGSGCGASGLGSEARRSRRSAASRMPAGIEGEEGGGVVCLLPGRLIA